MSDKKYNSNLPRPSSNNKKHDRILDKNSDNEQTQYIGSADSFSDTAEIHNNQRMNDNIQRQNFNRTNPNFPNNRSVNQRFTGNQQNNRQTPPPRQYTNYNRSDSGQRQQRYNNYYNQNQDYNDQQPINYNQQPNYQNAPNPNITNNRPPQQQRPPQQRQRQQPPQNRGRRPKRHPFASAIKHILTPIIIIALIIFAFYSFAALSFIKKMDYVPSNKQNNYSGLLSESYVQNILLIGTDGRTSDDRGRSDTVILLSINKKTNKTYLTSFMRDSYVDIDGYGQDKLNASYSYGGPDLLMDTIERNFKVKVDDYIAVNFNAFAAVVDAVDGVEINLSDEEAEAVNQILHDEVNELAGDPIDSDYLPSGGKYVLDGKQALSYSRIRYVGNSDFERTQRQRTVLEKIAGKSKTFNPIKLTNIMKAALPEMTTNMKTSELYILSLKAPFILGYDMEQLRIPADDTWTDCTTEDGGDALEVDFDANYDILKKSVFAD